MTARYACARMTVSKALSALVSAELIERRRRFRTFVAMPRTQSAVLEVRDLKDEIIARGSAYRYQLLSRELGRALAPEAATLGLAKGASILRVKALHCASDTPGHAYESKAFQFKRSSQRRPAGRIRKRR